jgi:uncharacterized membrane protein
MRVKKYSIYRFLIMAGVIIAVVVAVTTDTPIIAVAAVIAAVAVALLLERRNKEIVRDERISHISGKSSYIAFNIMLLLAGLSSLATALFRSRLPENVVFAGSIMGYSVCVALLLYMFLYIYLSRKL